MMYNSAKRRWGSLVGCGSLLVICLASGGLAKAQGQQGALSTEQEAALRQELTKYYLPDSPEFIAQVRSELGRMQLKNPNKTSEGRPPALST